MPSLEELLRGRNWYALRAIAYSHGRPFSSRLTKAQAVAYVATFLADSTANRAAVDALPEDARGALETVIACGGAMPAHRFLARFGPARPYRPWRADCPADIWRRPASPAERLWFMGFVFRYTSPAGEMMGVPDEPRRLLPSPDLITAEYVPSPSVAASDPILDLVHLLAYLQTHAARPLHSRWLAPQHLKCFESNLPSPDPTVAAARSELQAGYVRFLHYIAEAASLVASISGLLKPAPAAWTWLDLSEPDRWLHLWAGWKADLEAPSREMALWERFRLPGARPFVLTVFDVLSTVPATDQVAIPVLSGHLDRLCAGAETSLHGEGIATSLHRLIDGPLTWAGLVRLCGGDGVALTEIGGWILGQTKELPISPPMRPATIQRAERDFVAILLPAPPERPPLRPLVELPLTPDSRLSRRLTRERFTALLSHDTSCTRIVQNLLELTNGCLPQGAVDQIESWELDSRRIRLRKLTVMTATDADELALLSTKRAIRSHLGETLSPHHVAVDPSAIDRLLRALRRRGYTPLIEPGAAQASARQRVFDAGAATYLWLALRTYLELADLVELAAVPPAALLDELGKALDSHQLATLTAQATEVGHRLRNALDGYTPFPAPLDGVDHAAIRATVERAVEKALPVDIVYHTAGRGERTTRVVEPLRLEERGGTTYLVAYCRLRQAERVFRVDRIESARSHTMR